MLLLVGAYTKDMDELTPGRARGVSAYDFAPATGQLTFRGFVATTNPSYLWIDRDHRVVYAVRECPHDDGAAVVAFRVVRQPDRRIAFESLGEALLEGDHPCHLVGVDRTLIVCSYTSGTVDVFARNGGQGPGALLQHIELPGAGARADQPPRAHCAAFDPRRNRVYICDLGSNRLRVFDRRPTDGWLTLLPDHGLDFDHGTGPRHITLHPGGDYATVVCELRGICVLVDLRQDRPRFVHSIPYLPERALEEASGAAIRTGAAGRHLYVSDRTFSVITALRLDVQQGRLTARETYPSGGERPRDLVVSPDGDWLIAGNLKDHSLGVFRRSPGGGLKLYHVVKKVPSPTCLKWLAV